MSDLTGAPHRRRNALTGEWVLVSPQRALRPWQGQIEEIRRLHSPHYDPACYLCPGNERAGGARNPLYRSTFVFDNDFPALLPGTPVFAQDDPLLTAVAEPGLCRVVCFSPRHDLSLPSMDLDDLQAIVQTWC